jgi:MerR family transcriptional regulator, light-induced transcriptional regulator
MSGEREAVITLQDAAELLGVHYQTAYAWVRAGVLPARKAGRGYQVREADVLALAARRASGSPPRREVRVRDWSVQASLLYDAIIAGAETMAQARLRRLADGVRLVDMCELVIAPALRRIGDEWATGAVTIAAEHRASAICERLIAAYDRQPRGRPRGVAVATTPPGERHGLPALMAAACLREDRWLVHHLASDLPVPEVTRMTRDIGAGLVVLSTSSAGAARDGEEEAGQLRTALPDVRVLVGRPGDSVRELLRTARNPSAS